MTYRYLRGVVKNTTASAVFLAVLEYETPDGKVVKTDFSEWFPLSQLKMDDVVKGEDVELEASSWIMDKKGMV